ncbi:MAG: hypothetical protein FWH31_05300 [Streptococcaceae bacterium]|nr:hypothetical protein [Streptococcaceae bacterium]
MKKVSFLILLMLVSFTSFGGLGKVLADTSADIRIVGQVGAVDEGITPPSSTAPSNSVNSAKPKTSATTGKLPSLGEVSPYFFGLVILIINLISLMWREQKYEKG